LLLISACSAPGAGSGEVVAKASSAIAPADTDPSVDRPPPVLNLRSKGDYSGSTYASQVDIQFRVAGVKWDPPAGTTGSLNYEVYREGLLTYRGPGDPVLGNISPDWSQQLSGATHHFDVGYRNSAGVLSQLSSLDIVVPPPPNGFFGAPVSSKDADHTLTLGIVLLRFQDAPGPIPFTKDAMTARIFDATPGARSVRNYFRDTSRGRVDVVGDVFDWSVMTDASGTPRLLANECPELITDPTNQFYGLSTHFYTCAAWNDLPGITQRAGVDPTQYDGLIYYVFGVAGDGTVIYPYLAASAQSDADGLPSLSFTLHELGHELSLTHSYGATCPGPDLYNLGGDACPTTAGVSRNTYDSQAPESRFSHSYRMHTLQQYFLGFLHDDEWTTHHVGDGNATYTLGSPESASPLKQLRVELAPNFFYFLENRTATGWDAGFPGEQGYQDPEGVALWLWSPRFLGNNSEQTPVVMSNMQPGACYVDPYRNLSIGVVSKDAAAGTMAIEVRTDGTRCACLNGTFDSGVETDVDCGGECVQKCALGQKCEQDSDCGTLNGRPLNCSVETGICTTVTKDGAACSSNAECAGNLCLNGACAPQALQVDVGDGFACALLFGGRIRCWGQNDQGQLGVATSGSVGDEPGEVGPGLARVPLSGPATSFSLGATHGCAILQSGGVECWGSNNHGQLGAGDNSSHLGATVAADIGGAAAQLALGQEFSCARLTDGSVKCWGNNSFGRLGVGHTRDIGDDPNEMGSNLIAIALPRAAATIATGDTHACAKLSSPNEVRCWGLNFFGEAGVSSSYGVSYGDSSDELVPQPVALGTGFSPLTITLGSQHTCSRTSVFAAGQLKCWGANSLGQLGLGDTTWRGKDPASMGDALPVVPLTASRIDSGGNATCSIDSASNVRCLGFGTVTAQPGLGTVELGDQPNEVANLPPIDLGGAAFSIAVGRDSACAVMSPAAVIKCWGENEKGQLGVGDAVARGTSVAQMGANLAHVGIWP
jgi:alpha-tubulin suppressor-like RCC1 family protein